MDSSQRQRHLPLALILLFLIMSFIGLKHQWSGSSPQSPETIPSDKNPSIHPNPNTYDGIAKSNKIVVAHFMLGNTYSYGEADWEHNLLQGIDTGLDGFALNLGPELWQETQARSAYTVLTRLASSSSSTSSSKGKSNGSGSGSGMKLFLSLDMNVLPSSSKEDMQKLVDLVVALSASPSQMKTRLPHLGKGRRTIRKEGEENENEKVVLSTFGGHDASFDGVGWEGFLSACLKKGVDIYFIPSFFLPPTTILSNPSVDAGFSWNSGWSLHGESISQNDEKEDKPFLKDSKPYMAAVSPWFFTHYGKEGRWGWNKNWIYPSDENLYPTRWSHILHSSFNPEFVQIISWNDYGESHHIGDVMLDQPGSEAWTDGMDHSAWREMTKWFIRRYKGLSKDEEKLTVYLTYRLHEKEVDIEDNVGRPSHSEWAKDVISVFITVPSSLETTPLKFTLQNGAKSHSYKLTAGRDHHLLTIPFTEGSVEFKLSEHKEGEDSSSSGSTVALVEGVGKAIGEGKPGVYNFNAWTGSWLAK